MKKIMCVICALSSLTACTKVVDNYKLEKVDGYDVPVCVNHPQKLRQIKSAGMSFDACGRTIPATPEYKVLDGECDKISPQIVPYSYCLATMPKQVHLVEKKKDDMTICYDRNNKIELPILYCQKDMINIQNVNTYTSVVQRTNVAQKMVLY